MPIYQPDRKKAYASKLATPFYARSDDAKKAVEDAKEKLLAGEVTVDSAYGMDEATLKGIINGAQ